MSATPRIEALAATIGAQKAEILRLRGWLYRAFVLLDKFAGEGIFFPDLEEPCDLLTEYSREVGDDNWEKTLADLKPQTPPTEGTP